MGISRLFAKVYANIPSIVLYMLLSGLAFGQGVTTADLHEAALNFAPPNTDPGDVGIIAPGPIAVSPLATKKLPEAPSQHRFWDNENRALFVAVAALSTADFAVTRANLQNGGKELNPVTRVFSGSTAGLAVNFAGETAGVMGLSYYFHKTGHHELERITPMLNIGVSSFAVVYDLAHR